jgi:hypothetical protein
MCIVLHSGMAMRFRLASWLSLQNRAKWLLFFCLCDSMSGLARRGGFGGASASLPDN